MQISNKEIVTMANTDIIIHDEKDNVGVVVIEKITPSQDCNCWVMENDKSVQIPVSYTHLRAHET